MKKIAVFQSRSRADIIAAERDEYNRSVGNSADIVFISSLDGTLPWSDPQQFLEMYDGIIIGGSGEFDLHNEDPSDKRVVGAKEILQRLTPLIELLLARDFPTLGICFGHQLIGETRDGAVLSDPAQAKVGTYPVTLTSDGRDDLLFSELPGTFSAQYGHRNSLTSLPKGAVLLAKSDICKFSALRYSPRIYTVQFHPELTREDTLKKIAASPEYISADAQLDIKESPEASSIIPLFIEHCIR